jgi:hypothetical protein
LQRRRHDGVSHKLGISLEIAIVVKIHLGVS